MRFVEITITPKRGWFHPVDRLVEQDPGVERRRIQQINLLEDDTVVMLYELAGEHDHIQSIVDEYFEALAHSTSRIGENTLVWAHIEPSSLVTRLLTIPQEYNIVLQMPLDFTPSGGVKCLFVGDEGALEAATKALPEAVGVDVRRMGEYNPGPGRYATELTDRQAEILDAAIDLGYYEDPRHVTYDDIAERVNCGRTTVGEHLRKVESKVLPAVRP